MEAGKEKSDVLKRINSVKPIAWKNFYSEIRKSLERFTKAGSSPVETGELPAFLVLKLMENLPNELIYQFLVIKLHKTAL
ncbi:hypothetical protein C6Y45_03235 [Alkalicoccus saliphilus]|uniref:Uncharacterized protein n=1 Tax=Alkalicoccus saliphilus TaxID=200989 RepID=A0A2T4U9E0_9BACI|nr:hypothetical protein C6Y45_03235 [Alkalicoccus saliphilus]